MRYLFNPENFKTKYFNKIKDLLFDSRIVLENNKTVYLIVPRDNEIKNLNDSKDIIFMDPGLKNFQSSFSIEESGNYFTTFSPMEQDKNILRRKIIKLRKLKSLLDKKESKYLERYKLKKAIIRMTKKINNMVDSLHYNVANYITRNYKVIVIPRLNFHNLKSLRKKDKGFLMYLRHCTFVDRLKYCSLKNGSIVIETTEEFTSKTCSNCSFYKEGLGNKNIYKCSECSLEISRDLNGAINICNLFFTKIINSKSKDSFIRSLRGSLLPA